MNTCGGISAPMEDATSCKDVKCDESYESKVRFSLILFNEMLIFFSVEI